MDAQETHFPKKKSVADLYFIKAFWLTNISQWTRSVRLCPVRFGSVGRAVWMFPFHNVGLFSKPNRFGSVRLGLQCEWVLRLLVWQIPDAVCAVLNSWWWLEKPSETCRTSYRNKKIVKPCILLLYSGKGNSFHHPSTAINYTAVKT